MIFIVSVSITQEQSVNENNQSPFTYRWIWIQNNVDQNMTGVITYMTEYAEATRNPQYIPYGPIPAYESTLVPILQGVFYFRIIEVTAEGSNNNPVCTSTTEDSYSYQINSTFTILPDCYVSPVN